MFLHIGGDYSISLSSIIAILDFDITTRNESATIDFLRKCEKNQSLEYVAPGLPASVIIADDRVYVTPITIQTLRQRIIRNFEVVL